MVHSWILKPELTSGNDTVEWYQDDQDTTKQKSLAYTVTNKGPSLSTTTRLCVYLPKHPLVEHTNVRFNGTTCTKENKHCQTLPSVSASTGELGMLISCTKSDDCLIYKCDVSKMRKDDEETLRLTYQFQHKKAQEKSEDVTEFTVVTSICVQQSDQSMDCSEGGETKSEFHYYPPSPLDIIASNWQIIVAVAATILVLVIAVLLAWKFDLFQRARIIRNKGEGETTEANEPIVLEMK